MEEQSVRLFLNPSQPQQHQQQQQSVVRRKILRRLNNNSSHQSDRATISLERTQSTHKPNNIYKTNTSNNQGVDAPIQGQYSQHQKTKSCSNHMKLADKQFASLQPVQTAEQQQEKHANLYDPECIIPITNSSSRSRGRRLICPASVGNTRSSSRSTTNTSSRPPSQIRTARRLVVREEEEQGSGVISKEQQVQIPLKNELISLLNNNANAASSVENHLNSSDQGYLNKIKVANRNRHKQLQISTTPLRIVGSSIENEVIMQQKEITNRQNNTSSMNLELEDLKKIQLLGRDFLDQPICQTLDISYSNIKSGVDQCSRRYKRSGVFWKPRMLFKNDYEDKDDSKQFLNLTICSSQQESQQQQQVKQLEKLQDFELRQLLKNTDHLAACVSSENNKKKDEKVNNHNTTLNQEMKSQSYAGSKSPPLDFVSEGICTQEGFKEKQNVKDINGINQLEIAALVSQGLSKIVERNTQMEITNDQEKGEECSYNKHNKLMKSAGNGEGNCENNIDNKINEEQSCNKLFLRDFSAGNEEKQNNQISSVFLDLKEQTLTQISLPQPQKTSLAASLQDVFQAYHLVVAASQEQKCNIITETSNEITCKVVPQYNSMIGKDDVGAQHSISKQISQSINKETVKEERKCDKIGFVCALLEKYSDKKGNVNNQEEELQVKVCSNYQNNSFDESSCSGKDEDGDVIVVAEEEVEQKGKLKRYSEENERINRNNYQSQSSTESMLSKKKMNYNGSDENCQYQADDCYNNYKEKITKSQEEEDKEEICEECQSSNNEDIIEESQDSFELSYQPPLNAAAGQVTISKARVRDVFNEEFWNPVAFPKNYAITSSAKSTNLCTQQISINKHTIQGNKENNKNPSLSARIKAIPLKKRSSSFANQELKPTETTNKAAKNNFSRNQTHNYYLGESHSQLFDEVNDKRFWQQPQSSKVDTLRIQPSSAGNQENNSQKSCDQKQPFQQQSNNSSFHQAVCKQNSEIAQQNYEEWDAELELLS